jgi:hypothetical protein
MKQAVRQEFPVLLAVCFVALILGGLGAIGWLYVFEQPYLEYRNIPFPITDNPVRAGDSVPLTVSRCSRASTPRTYTLTHSLENIKTHAVVLLPETQSYIQPGCSIGLSSLHTVPKGTPTGRYRVYGLAEVRTSFRTHYVEWYSQEFDVIGN